ncbi:MAG: hypothetical protein ACRCYU_11020 [Nocardioides sp.]
MTPSQLAAVAEEEVRKHCARPERLSVKGDIDTMQIFCGEKVVGEFWSDGRFKVVLDDFLSSFYAYQDDEQIETTQEIVRLIARWADGETVIRCERGLFGRRTYWASMPGFRQQFRRDDRSTDK